LAVGDFIFFDADWSAEMENTGLTEPLLPGVRIIGVLMGNQKAPIATQKNAPRSSVSDPDPESGFDPGRSGFFLRSGIPLGSMIQIRIFSDPIRIFYDPEIRIRASLISRSGYRIRIRKNCLDKTHCKGDYLMYDNCLFSKAAKNNNKYSGKYILLII